MARKSKSEQEQGYLRNYWDELREMEADYRGVALCSVEASPRPGVLRFRMSFTPMLGSAENGVGASMYQFEYPNAQNGTLAAALWAGSLKLLALVEVNARVAPHRADH